MHAKSIDFRKKVFISRIRTRDLNASRLLYPLSYMAVVFDGMLLEFSTLQFSSCILCTACCSPCSSIYSRLMNTNFTCGILENYETMQELYTQSIIIYIIM